MLLQVIELEEFIDVQINRHIMQVEKGTTKCSAKKGKLPFKEVQYSIGTWNVPILRLRTR